MPFNAALEKLHTSIVTDDPAPAASLVRPKQHMSAEEQIGIYAYAYKARLRQAVLSDYPCLLHVIGETTINNLVNAYVDATPSHSYNLDFYPHAFWRYLQKRNDDIALRELAALEGAIAETFMGSGSEPLTPQNLPPLTEETLGQTKFTLRTPHRLLNFTHDVEETMANFKRGETPTPIAAKPTYLYVYRHNNEVQRRPLDEIEFHLLSAIQQTESFDAAIRQTMKSTGCTEETLANNMPHYLSRWIGEGFFRIQKG